MPQCSKCFGSGLTGSPIQEVCSQCSGRGVVAENSESDSSTEQEPEDSPEEDRPKSWVRKLFS